MTAIARTTDPETSHQAAASVTDLRQKQYLVLKVLRRRSSFGYTDEELVETYCALAGTRAGWAKQSESGIRTRRSELVRLGFVEDSGQRRVMSTGRMARVWRIK